MKAFYTPMPFPFSPNFRPHTHSGFGGWLLDGGGDLLNWVDSIPLEDNVTIHNTQDCDIC